MITFFAVTTSVSPSPLTSICTPASVLPVNLPWPLSHVILFLRNRNSMPLVIVEKMTKGIEFLFRKNKITWLKGHGKFTGKTDAGVQIEVSGEGETEVVTAKNVIIATGSKARHLRSEE